MKYVLLETSILQIEISKKLDKLPKIMELANGETFFHYMHLQMLYHVAIIKVNLKINEIIIIIIIIIIFNEKIHAPGKSGYS